MLASALGLTLASLLDPSLAPSLVPSGTTTVETRGSDRATLAPVTAKGHGPDEEFTQGEDEEWVRAPREESRIYDSELCGREGSHVDLLLDYNRVDQLRLGLRTEIQKEQSFHPRVGVRLEYAFERERILYGSLIHQPLTRSGWLGLGAALYRRTDHGELQQTSDIENTADVLFARFDYRDYFEREGMDGYLSARLRRITNVSLHARSDDYHSLALRGGTRSLFHRDRPLRGNPPVDEGNLRSLALRAERPALVFGRAQPGTYHWGEMEWAGRRMGGDFRYTRALGDLRSFVRLSPTQLVALRAAAGSTIGGALPFQKRFTVGGVDGLRAHSFARYRGNHMLLGSAEYSVGLWRWARSPWALAFVDVAKAWSSPAGDFALGKQIMPVDGGFGLASSEDNMRVYFAKNLQEPSSDFVVSVRLHRPF